MSLTILIGRKHTAGPIPDPVPGDPLGGGYYVGNIVISGNIYRVIVAPKSAEASLAYKTAASADTGNTSLNDGLANSNALNDASHPAIQYCRSYTGGGNTDWYMGSRDEWELFYRNLKPTGVANTTGSRVASGAGSGNTGNNPNSLPTGADYTTGVPAQTSVALFRSGGAQAAAVSDFYWLSTNAVGSGYDPYAMNQGMDNGVQTASLKTASRFVRPMRKILVGPAPAEPNIGDAYEGGYYAGDVVLSGNTYRVVVAPKSSEVTRAWKTTLSSDSIAASVIDGLANSNAMNSATYPAAQYCRSLNIGGKTDWFLPARDQLEVIQRNLKSTTQANSTAARPVGAGGGSMGANSNSSPVGAAYTSTVPAQTGVAIFQEGGAQALGDSTGIRYWSSTNTQSGTVPNAAISQYFGGSFSGYQSADDKNIVASVRAIRLVLKS